MVEHIKAVEIIEKGAKLLRDDLNKRLLEEEAEVDRELLNSFLLMSNAGLTLSGIIKKIDNTNMLKPSGLSKETEQWLGGWLSGGAEMEHPSDSIIEELKPYRLKTKRYIYRAEVTYPNVDKRQAYTTCTSWTYDFEVANNFSANGDLKPHKIICAEILPEQTLVDTTTLPKSFMRHHCYEEKEIIVLPGTYDVDNEIGSVAASR